MKEMPETLVQSLRGLDLIPALGSSPGGGNGDPLQYSCLEIPWMRNSVGYSLWDRKEMNTPEWLSTWAYTHTHTHTHTHHFEAHLKLTQHWKSTILQFKKGVESLRGEGNGTPLQYSCLENPMDRGAGRLQSMGSLRVRNDWVTSLSIFTFHFYALVKEMATHSSVLAWRIPGTGEPGGLPSMGSHRVGHDWSNLAAAAESLRGNETGWTLWLFAAVLQCL